MPHFSWYKVLPSLPAPRPSLPRDASQFRASLAPWRRPAEASAVRKAEAASAARRAHPELRVCDAGGDADAAGAATPCCAAMAVTDGGFGAGRAVGRGGGDGDVLVPVRRSGAACAAEAPPKGGIASWPPAREGWRRAGNCDCGGAATADNESARLRSGDTVAAARRSVGLAAPCPRCDDDPS